jgi:hypothetical protein
MGKALRSAIRDVEGDCLYDGETSYAGNFYLATHINEDFSYGGIRFLDENGVCREFFIDDDNVLKEITGGQAAQYILSDTLVVNHVKFILNGRENLVAAGQLGNVQPRVTMLLAVQSPSDAAQEKIIQTTVIQRNLNVP